MTMKQTALATITAVSRLTPMLTSALNVRTKERQATAMVTTTVRQIMATVAIKLTSLLCPLRASESTLVSGQNNTDFDECHLSPRK